MGRDGRLFARRCSEIGQFWEFIQYENPIRAERRSLIWDAIQCR